MSLREIMKLRMTISKYSAIHSVETESNKANTAVSELPTESESEKIVTVPHHGSENTSLKEWREQLEKQLRKAEVSFHYKGN